MNFALEAEYFYKNPQSIFSNKDARAPAVDAYNSFEYIVNKNGYKAVETEIVTDDGYILSLWNIPGTLKEKKVSKKPPVLLVAGM